MLNQRLQDEIMMDRLYWVSRDVDDKLDILEKLVVQTARICKAVDEKLETIPERGDDTIQKLLQTRRGLDNGPESREARGILSKQIQKATRKALREKKRMQIAKRLDDFKDLKKIVNIRANGRTNILQSVVDKDGRVQNGRQDIVDV